MLQTSQQLTDQQKKTLAPYAVTETQGRQHPEPPASHRTPFQRDRDRVIHARAFRRLKDKTQVFTSTTGDHYRTRLTHTMEVAQISRDIARTFALNEDLAETIALAHDLGHTPFGHAGETALNEVLQEFGLSFEHNEQSKRVVEQIEHPYPHFPGLNLTKESIDGLIKHQSPYDNATKTFKYLPSLEAQIVNLADEIAYTAHDTDDGLRSKIFTQKDLEKIDLWQQAKELAHQQYKIPTTEEIKRDRIISKLINLIISDLCQTTEQTLQENQINSLEKVRTFNGKLANFSPEMKLKLAQLRKFLYENLYFSPQVHNSMQQGQKMIKSLFHHYYKNPNELPEHFAPKESPLTSIRDYIAGMTDGFAQEQWSKISK